MIASLLLLAALSAEPSTPAAPDGPPVGGRVVFLGNSIARHEPAPGVGWRGDWGMAASSADRDFVHLVVGALRLTDHVIVSAVDWEQSPDTFDLSRLAPHRGAALLIVKLGENVKRFDERFPAAFDRLLRSMQARCVLVVGTYWNGEVLDKVNGAMFANTIMMRHGWAPLPPHDPGTDAGASRFADAEVAAHPGDAGMAIIADAILGAWRRGWSPGCGGTTQTALPPRSRPSRTGSP